MEGLKDLERVLDMMNIESDDKDNVMKHSVVFFEYRDYMKEKHSATDEEIDRKTNLYIKTRIDADEELLSRVQSGDMSVIGEISEVQAKEEGFEKPLVESMNVFMEFFSKMGNNG